MTVVLRAKHWGFCSANCKLNQWASVLQETSLHVLTPEECSTLADPSMEYLKEREICAAYKIPFPVMKVFKRNKQVTNKEGAEQYKYEYAKDLRNTVSISLQQRFMATFRSYFFQLGAYGKPAKLDFYIGRTDTCQGDSGGPLVYFQGAFELHSK